MKFRVIFISIITIFLISIIGILIYSNIGIEYNYYDLGNDFNVKICHISDYHNNKLDKNIVNKIKEENVDIIAITGDLIDSGSSTNVISFIKEIKEIAPIFYVTGNHEADDLKFLKGFLNELESLGINVLQNSNEIYTKNGKSINIIGIDDPLISDSSSFLSSLNDSYFKLLLTHRPERINQYAAANIDLVLAGHAHGGLFKIPLIGGLFAPNQGFFPKYYEGLYQLNSTKMIVSKGVGNSVIPVRFLNKAEVIFINL